MAKKTAAEENRRRFAKSSKRRVHHRLLFHWIGSHIESNTTLDLEAKRGAYVDCLRNSLNPKQGLWLNPPRDPDILLDGQVFRITEPICCFTETALDEIQDHSARYGKLGLGFPKRFVLDRGGRPVNYVLDRKTDPTMSAWLSLARAIHDPDVLNALPNQMRITLENELRFVSQFLKRIRQPSQARSTTKKKAMHKSKGHTAMATKPVRRSFGGPLHYLEEREWRFVLRRKGNTVIPKGAIENRTYKENNGPRWYLPYSAGDDLFTIVFPDNQTMARAIGDKIIRRAISNNDRPHVTLLTIEDIGTF